MKQSNLLFQPVRIGAWTLPNRFVMAPLTRCRASAGRIPNALMAEYYAQRSSAGLILSEATSVMPMGVGYPDTPGIWSAEQVEGWKWVTQAVHQAGGRILLQLWHVGRISDPIYLDGELPVAPSAIRPAGHINLVRPKRGFETPRALETEEISSIVAAYRRGAENAKAAGFDGVEVHGANGYLLDQFLQNGTNRRTDRYGGSIENRARLMLEVLDEVIDVWGADRVGLHLAPRSDAHDMSDSDPAATFGYIAREAGRRKIAFLFAREGLAEPRLAPALKKEFGGPFIANQQLSFEDAEALVESGEADAAAWGQLFIANPDLPERYAEGATLNEPQEETFYEGGAAGYTDYPSRVAGLLCSRNLLRRAGMNKKAVFKTVGAVVAGVALGWCAKGMMGGGGPPPGMGGMQMPPATVKVLVVEETLLNAADESIARVEPMQEVIIRPEVSGKIDQVNFTEGSVVKEGDLLFTIDHSAYQATANAAEAEMVRAQKRYDRLKQADVRSVSASDLESAESEALRGKAAYELAMVDLNYTEIKAPVSGRIGAAMVKKGNVVTPSSIELARIVQVDPIRVVFSQTDREYLAFRRLELSGDAEAFEARVILADGSVLMRPASQVPNIGKKDFDDNAINPMTGTLAVRYLFDNQDGLLLPGGYVTVRLSNPAGETGIKIPQRALLVDQDGAYVLSVNEAGIVGILRVEVGDQVGPDAIILSGLKPGDRVVIDGVQKAIPGTTVQVMGE